MPSSADFSTDNSRLPNSTDMIIIYMGDYD